MNQGMYGMTDGRGMVGRKLAGRVGYGDSTAVALANFRAQTLTNTVTSSLSIPQARTRVISVNGRGAARALAVGHVTDNASSTYTVEIVIDGVVAVTRSSISMAGGSGSVFPFVGAMSGNSSGAPYGLSPDYVPFDSSFEVFITTTGPSGSTTFNIPHWVDIHQ